MLGRSAVLAVVVCALSGCPNGAGITCPSGQSFCGGRCIVTTDDPMNCGGCNVICATGTFCAAGQCVPICPKPLAVCGTQCVDEQNDPANCGSCGTTCAADHFCSGGSCVYGCPSTLTKCNAGTSCVDTNVDVNNCGFCGNACLMNNICCAGHCVPFNTNMHCGGCAPCPMGQSCIDYMMMGFMCILG